MTDLFDRAKQASKAAPLQQREEVKTPAAPVKRKRGRPAGSTNGPVRRKNLNMPEDFFARFDAVRASGKTALDFHGFCLEAIREKFEALE
jgi:hypothetical protein